MERTLIKLRYENHMVILTTYSRKNGASSSFYLHENEIYDLTVKGKIFSIDEPNVATFRYDAHNDRVTVNIKWLKLGTNDDFCGRQETIVLSGAEFFVFVHDSRIQGEGKWITLSLPLRIVPKIQINSRQHLHDIARQPQVRRKFAKVLERLSYWNEKAITLYDDFEPYSFYFVSDCGMSGGVILHDRENLSRSYYGIHT